MGNRTLEELSALVQDAEALIKASDESGGAIFEDLKDMGVDIPENIMGEVVKESAFAPGRAEYLAAEKIRKAAELEAQYGEDATHKQVQEGKELSWESKLATGTLVMYLEKLLDIAKESEDGDPTYRAMSRAAQNLTPEQVLSLDEKVLGRMPDLMGESDAVMRNEECRKLFVKLMKRSARKDKNGKRSYHIRDFQRYEFWPSDKELFDEIVESLSKWNKDWDSVTKHFKGIGRLYTPKEYMLRHCPSDISGLTEKEVEESRNEIRAVWMAEAEKNGGVGWLVATTCDIEQFKKVVDKEMSVGLREASRWEREPDRDNDGQVKKWRHLMALRLEAVCDDPKLMNDEDFGEEVCDIAHEMLERQENVELLNRFYKGPFLATFKTGRLFERMHFEKREPFFENFKSRGAWGVVLTHLSSANMALALLDSYMKDTTSWMAQRQAEDRAVLLSFVTRKLDSQTVGVLRKMAPEWALYLGTGKGDMKPRASRGNFISWYMSPKNKLDGTTPCIAAVMHMDGLLEKAVKENRLTEETVQVLLRKTDDGDEAAKATVEKLMRISPQECVEGRWSSLFARSVQGGLINGTAGAKSAEAYKLLTEGDANFNSMDFESKAIATKMAADNNEWALIEQAQKDSRLALVFQEKVKAASSKDILSWLKDACFKKMFFGLQDYNGNTKVTLEGVDEKDSEKVFRELLALSEKERNYSDETKITKNKRLMEKIIKFIPPEKCGFLRDMILKEMPWLPLESYDFRGEGRGRTRNKDSLVGSWSAEELIDLWEDCEKIGHDPFHVADINDHPWDLFAYNMEGDAEKWRATVAEAERRGRLDLSTLLHTSNVIQTFAKEEGKCWSEESTAKWLTTYLTEEGAEGRFERLLSGIDRLMERLKEESDGKALPRFISETIRGIVHATYWDKPIDGSWDREYKGDLPLDMSKALLRKLVDYSPGYLIDCSAIGCIAPLSKSLEEDFDKYLPNMEPKDILIHKKGCKLDLREYYGDSDWMKERSISIARGYMASKMRSGDVDKVKDLIRLIKWREKNGNAHEICPILDVLKENKDSVEEFSAAAEALELSKVAGRNSERAPVRRRKL